MRGLKGEPGFVSRFYLETLEIPEIKKNGVKVAVAGAGPAGITMSLLMLMNGYDMTLFEAQAISFPVRRRRSRRSLLRRECSKEWKNIWKV